MVRWNTFTPSDIEYDFESDKLAAHNITFDEAVECFFTDFEIRKNKRYRDRYQTYRGNAWWAPTQDHLPTQTGQSSANNLRVAAMKQRKKKNGRRLLEEVIDRIVESQANDDSAWEQPIEVRRTEPAPLTIPAELAARAAFVAKLHKEKSIEAWLTRVIKERVEMEEVAFTEAKREMSLRNGA